MGNTHTNSNINTACENFQPMVVELFYYLRILSIHPFVASPGVTEQDCINTNFYCAMGLCSTLNGACDIDHLKNRLKIIKQKMEKSLETEVWLKQLDDRIDKLMSANFIPIEFVTLVEEFVSSPLNKIRLVMEEANFSNNCNYLLDYPLKKHLCFSVSQIWAQPAFIDLMLKVDKFTFFQKNEPTDCIIVYENANCIGDSLKSYNSSFGINQNSFNIKSFKGC